MHLTNGVGWTYQTDLVRRITLLQHRLHGLYCIGFSSEYRPHTVGTKVPCLRKSGNHQAISRIAPFIWRFIDGSRSLELLSEHSITSTKNTRLHKGGYKKKKKKWVLSRGEVDRETSRSTLMSCHGSGVAISQKPRLPWPIPNSTSLLSSGASSPHGKLAHYFLRYQFSITSNLANATDFNSK